VSVPALQLVPGTRLGHYEVLGPIGQGGMGEVYRARDPRLERDVALKILRRRLAEDEEARARFEREAKAIAALSHPNIVAIFDTGVDRGIPFSVTELLDGQTLRSKLGDGPMPWKAACDLAAALADGLAAAHERGIVHRDVKPENVFVTRDGRVKILDFGLARSTTGPNGEHAPSANDSPTVIETSSGTVMGTVGYMAPEQVRGQSVGPAADLFSLGCMLFEMVSGRRPFERATAADTVAAVLHDPPPVLSDSGVVLPAALDRIVRHCLERVPERRFRSARDLAAALRSIALDSSTPTTTRDRKSSVKSGVKGRVRTTPLRSLAILPFAASGDGADLAFLGEGLAESILNTIAGLQGVRVVPRTLAFRHAGRESDPRALGAELNADALVSGHISIRGGQLHVQADLVDTSDESQIWGNRFVRPEHDLEAVAPLIARDIYEALGARFDLRLPKPKAARARKRADSEAYQEFLRGRHHWNKWTREGVRLAIEAFRRAIDLDPAYAPAYAGLADAYGAAAYYGYLPAADVLPLANHAAGRALELDPDLAEAHATLGIAAMFFEWDWPEADRRLARAVALDDRCMTAHAYRSLYLACQGRMLDALEAGRRAERLDPMSLLAMSCVAWGLLHTGDVESAEAQLHRMLGVDPEFPDALMLLSHVAEARQDVELAAAYNRRWFPRMGLGEADAESLLAAHRESGWPGYWRRYLVVLDAGTGCGCNVTAVMAATIHAMLGEEDLALDALERAYEVHAPMLAFSKVDMHLATLRGHPRFEALLRRLRLSD
jgi:serine/threonine protein kinase/tetratricopeptide (TPR) repeat protein